MPLLQCLERILRPLGRVDADQEKVSRFETFENFLGALRGSEVSRPRYQHV
jgi:hypothetical protein